MGASDKIKAVASDKIKGLWRRLFGRTAKSVLDPTRPDLVVVAASFDDVEACSAALERAAAESPRWDPAAEAVLRHHLRLPSDRFADAAAIAAQDGYVTGDMERMPSPPVGDDPMALVLQRVQVLDALHCSQERSRMAGLAQRLDGTALGWDALQPASGDGGPGAG